MDFQFYLNRQGVRGAKGTKGDKGDSPIVSVNKHTANEYVLQIDNPDGTQIITPNLVGQQIVVNTAGDYVKYDRVSGKFITVELPSATDEEEGLIRLATDADYTERNEFSAVTPYGLVKNLPNLITTSADNLIRISYDEPTDSVVIDTSKINSDISAAAATATEALTTSQNNTNEINILKDTVNSINENYVTLNTVQTVSNKTMANFTAKGSIWLETQNASISAGYVGTTNNGTGYHAIVYGNNELELKTGAAGGAYIRLNSNGISTWGDFTFGKKPKYSQKYLLTTNSITAGNGINLNINETLGNIEISSATSGGADIDDTTTASDKVWSSSKTNSEISTVANELVQTQGDVASLDADMTEITPIVHAHTESISSINDSISQLNSKVANILDRIAVLETTVTSLQTQIGEISAKLDTINGEDV